MRLFGPARQQIAAHLLCRGAVVRVHGGLEWLPEGVVHGVSGEDLPGAIQERPSALLIHLEDDLFDLVDQPPALLFAPLQRLVPGAIRAEGEGLPLRDAGVDQPAQGHLQHDEKRNRGECDDGGPARGVRGTGRQPGVPDRDTGDDRRCHEHRCAEAERTLGHDRRICPSRRPRDDGSALTMDSAHSARYRIPRRRAVDARAYLPDSTTARPVFALSRAASRISETITLFSSEVGPDGTSRPRTTAVR